MVLTHNRRQEVLRSLARLTNLPEKPRILVVDNGSSDDTVAEVARQYPGIEVCATGANLGASGRNLGIQLLDQPYIAMCDDDTWWKPGSLRRAVDLFDAHPRLAVACARVLVGTDEQIDPTCLDMEESPLPAEPEMPGPPLLGFLAGASVVRRSAFMNVGGFEPRFFIGGEEELLAVDLAAAGWWLCYVPELIVHHFPSELRDATSRRWQLVRNGIWSAWLRRPVTSALRKTWQLTFNAPLQSSTWKGFWKAVTGLPWIVRERRVIPDSIERGLRLLEGRPAPGKLQPLNAPCFSIATSKPTG
jgi:GT2 family glycosyltransferase